MSVPADGHPAGGLLLAGVSEAFTCAVRAAYSGETGGCVQDPARLAKDAVLVFVLEGRGSSVQDMLRQECRNASVECRDLAPLDWRASLPASLTLADRLLDEVVEAYRRVYPYVLDGYFRLLDKGLTGVGSGVFRAVFEVGLQMDWLLGLPYYPGSTLKGAARSAAEALLGEEAAEALFGEAGLVGHKSLLSFADSYPVGCYQGDGEGLIHPCMILTGDVVSPHYFKPGLGLVESELDAEPTPVVHLAIAPGTVFRVVVGLELPDGERLRGAFAEAVKRGLLSNGRVNVSNMAVLVSRIVGAALLTGFAARSGRGYNVLSHIPRDKVEAVVKRGVVRIRLYAGGEQRAPGRGHQQPRTARRGRPGRQWR